MDTLRAAASEQLTGTLPGVLCAKFEALNADQLLELWAETTGKPSKLRIETSKILDSASMDHVARIVFMADGNVEPTAPGVFTRMGRAYAFPNPRSPAAKDERLALFGDEAAA